MKNATEHIKNAVLRRQRRIAAQQEAGRVRQRRNKYQLPAQVSRGAYDAALNLQYLVSKGVRTKAGYPVQLPAGCLPAIQNFEQAQAAFREAEQQRLLLAGARRRR